MSHYEEAESLVVGASVSSLATSTELKLLKAQVLATLAVADQQRAANVIALEKLRLDLKSLRYAEFGPSLVYKKVNGDVGTRRIDPELAHLLRVDL